MKKYVIFVIIICTILWAQEEDPLAERIEKLSEELFEGYTQPLVTAFGTGISTGLFHSAYSHDFLGFDLGVRGMYIQVPHSAKYFSGTALLCSLGTDGLVYDNVDLDSMSTVFGPDEETIVPTTGNAVGIPDTIPGGFDVSGVPLLVPQLNIGLPAGSEIAIRYIPFTYKGSSMRFMGIGIKQELTRLPPFNTVPMPVAIAIGGAYQRFSVKDSLGKQIVNSSNWVVQLLVSKRIAVFEPFAGVGYEDTKVYLSYEFEYQIPDTVSGIPTDLITVTEDIDVEIYGQNHYRAMIGFNLNLGFIYLHYDYNFLPYAVHNAIIGITIR
jgi:hypothetical protein